MTTSNLNDGLLVFDELEEDYFEKYEDTPKQIEIKKENKNLTRIRIIIYYIANDVKNVLSQYNLKVEKDYPELDTKIDEKRIMQVCLLKIHLYKELNENRNKKRFVKKTESRKNNKNKTNQSNLVAESDEFYNRNIMVNDINKKEQKNIIRKKKKRLRILRFKKIIKQKKKRNKIKKNFLKSKKIQLKYFFINKPI
jgi:hypothetical protein